MNTYEQGKAPADAPVVWTRDKDGFVGRMYVNGESDYLLGADIETPEIADRVCRAFHLAKLSDEAASMLSSAPLTPPGTTDWIRRYREAVK